MALRPTAISYKDNIEDKKLKEWIHSHSNYSGFIKDILRAKMIEENTVRRDTVMIAEENENNLIDF